MPSFHRFHGLLRAILIILSGLLLVALAQQGTGPNHKKLPKNAEPPTPRSFSL